MDDSPERPHPHRPRRHPGPGAVPRPAGRADPSRHRPLARRPRRPAVHHRPLGRPRSRRARGPPDRGADQRVPGRVLIDPADASGEVTSAIDWYEPSPDGVARGVRHVHRGRRAVDAPDPRRGARATLLADALPHTRAASVAWLPDGSGFAYTRYPDPAEVGDDEAGYHRTVWWHRLGDERRRRHAVLHRPPDKEAWPEVSLSQGRALAARARRARVEPHRRAPPRSPVGPWTTIIEGVEATTWFRVDVDRERLVGATTLDAPKGRLVAALLGEPVARALGRPGGRGRRRAHRLRPHRRRPRACCATRAGVSSLHLHEPSGAPIADITSRHRRARRRHRPGQPPQPPGVWSRWRTRPSPGRTP